MTRLFRSIFSGVTAAFLCLCGFLSAEAQDVFLRPAMEEFIDKETMLVFPAIVDTFQKVRVRKNENPVFGTVVRYENEAGTCADVYIYSLDTGAREVRQDEFEKHFRETDQDILKMPEQNQKIKSAVPIEIPGRKVPAGGHEAHYRIQNGPVQMDSILFLALYKGKLVKLRISYSPDDQDEAAGACRFVDAIAAMLNRSGTAETQKTEEAKTEKPLAEAKTGN